MRSIKSRLLLKGYKNKQSIITILLALVVMAGQAQQTMTVKDSITNEPVPFVSVYFGNDSGGYTDEQGAIAIPSEIEQIRFSHICYESKSIAKVIVDSQTIFLVPKSINLDEVAISAKALKRTKTTEVGSMKAKTQTKHKGANGFEMALFIPYDSTWAETPYIHSIFGKSRLFHPLAGIHGNQDTHLCHSPL